MYLSDRHRVEICLPAQMMLACAIVGIPKKDQETEDFKTFKQNLLQAGWEPVEDLDYKKQQNVLRRVVRLHQSIPDQVIGDDHGNIPKLALVQFHLIRFIIEDGYLQYEEDGIFHRAVLTFMEALQHHAAEERFNASAIKAAKKLLRRLQSEGYYRGVVVPD